MKIPALVSFLVCVCASAAGFGAAAAKPNVIFIMADDLDEKKSVAAAHPDLVKKFEHDLNTERTENQLWPIVENAQKKGGGAKKKSTGK